MEVYHGSFIKVTAPEISYSRETLDFGKGFYVTPIREQAESWAKRFKRRKGKSIVNIYVFDQDNAEAEFVVKNFESYNDEWIEFILNCRNANDMSDYDVISGGVANDKIFDTVELYFNGLIDRTEALKRLKYEKPNLQICIRKQECIDKYLRYKGCEEI